MGKIWLLFLCFVFVACESEIEKPYTANGKKPEMKVECDGIRGVIVEMNFVNDDGNLFGFVDGEGNSIPCSEVAGGTIEWG